MIAVALVALLAAAAVPACNNPAAYVMPGEHLVGFDGRTFIPIMASISPEPLPPSMAFAVLVVAYLGDDPKALATLRFFDANGCSTGIVTHIPIEALHFIDQHMGTAA
jgi:hypothetical protein